MSASNSALHGGLLARLRGGLAMLRSGRFWRHARLLDLVKNVDKLF
jgi:hypothetical protein